MKFCHSSNKWIAKAVLIDLLVDLLEHSDGNVLIRTAERRDDFI